MTSSLRLDAEETKNRPVSKVITLLKDMLKQLEKEANGDDEVCDKILVLARPRLAHMSNGRGSGPARQNPTSDSHRGFCGG